MKKNKLIYLVLLWLPVFISCADDDHNNPDTDTGDGQVHLKATVAKNSVLTRSDDPPTDENYYLYYTAVGKDVLSANPFNFDGDTWIPNPILYWDDIKKEATNTFYLTNMDGMTFSTKAVNKDILYGETTGWNTPLNFTLNHLTSKITVIVYDNTLNKDIDDKKVDFKNAKVVFNPGLNRTTTGIVYTTGEIISLDTDKERTTTINQFTEKEVTIADPVEKSGTYNGVESAPLYIVPHTFSEDDQLEVTAGTYVYRIPVPIPEGESYPFSLGVGEHLTIHIELSEDVISATAKLMGWEEKPAGSIEVSRVFNIASWNELRDLAQAVATGYTFKGMVVRLTDHIELQDQISLGTEKYPFEGVFSGGGFSIKNLGIQGTDMRRNKGGLFGYTSGATIQDVILVAPYVESNDDNPVGALIDHAKNTTVFNCRTGSISSTDTGEVDGGAADHVGGLIGEATGTSTLLNCYSLVRVTGTGEFIGGLIGYSEASITHCYAKGEVDCLASTHVGGLAGAMYGSMRYCYAQGDVTGKDKLGGLVGHLEGTVDQCYASGLVDGDEAGGLVSCIEFGAKVENSFWHSQNANGSGSGISLETCKPFSDGTKLLDAGYLDNSTGVWRTPIENFPEFANQ